MGGPGLYSQGWRHQRGRESSTERTIGHKQKTENASHRERAWSWFYFSISGLSFNCHLLISLHSMTKILTLGLFVMINKSMLFREFPSVCISHFHVLLDQHKGYKRGVIVSNCQRIYTTGFGKSLLSTSHVMVSWCSMAHTHITPDKTYSSFRPCLFLLHFLQTGPSSRLVSFSHLLSQ